MGIVCNWKHRRSKMTYIVEKEDDTYIASTNDYPGTFYGYGETEEDAIEDLKAEVEFALTGGYKNPPH